ncbi:MAG: hypothetical protein Q4G70_09070 [Pseudomonadota bacterium]|nr:hypothetical protein [Pseudomonadota bacterium]
MTQRPLTTRHGRLEQVTLEWEVIDQREAARADASATGIVNLLAALLRVLGTAGPPPLARATTPSFVERLHVHLCVDGQALTGAFDFQPASDRPEVLSSHRERSRLTARPGDRVTVVSAPGQPAALRALCVPELHAVQIFDTDPTGRWAGVRAIATVIGLTGAFMGLMLLLAMGFVSWMAGADSEWPSFPRIAAMILMGVTAIGAPLVLILSWMSWPRFREAEAVFAALGWPKPAGIDLALLDARHRPDWALSPERDLYRFFYPPDFDRPPHAG